MSRHNLQFRFHYRPVRNGSSGGGGGGGVVSRRVVTSLPGARVRALHRTGHGLTRFRADRVDDFSFSLRLPRMTTSDESLAVGKYFLR